MFGDISFEIVFCRKVLFCLDLHKAYSEIARVLKPDGYAVIIAALGHNPLTDLKRIKSKETQGCDSYSRLFCGGIFLAEGTLNTGANVDSSGPQSDIHVSIVIPCLNEERFIGECLDSIIANDFHNDRFEVFVVDGMSEDRTVEIVLEYVEKHPFIKLLHNPRKFAPVAQNIGIEQTKGRFVFQIDAHVRIQKDYLSTCVEYLETHRGVDAVGGPMVTLPKDSTAVGNAIALALSCPFGVGNSTFRIGSDKVREVESVYCGCYRKEIYDRIGGYNEDLFRGHDYEFPRRLKAAGGQILLIPETVTFYYARSSFNIAFVKYYFWEGFWAVYPFRIVGRKYLTWSHLVPCVFVTSLIFTAGLSCFFLSFKWLLFLSAGIYLLTNLAASIQIAIRVRDVNVLFLLPVIFLTIHISYGLGSIYAFLKALLK